MGPGGRMAAERFSQDFLSRIPGGTLVAYP
jgi:hypothetical protein